MFGPRCPDATTRRKLIQTFVSLGAPTEADALHSIASTELRNIGLEYMELQLHGQVCTHRVRFLRNPCAVDIRLCRTQNQILIIDSIHWSN